MAASNIYERRDYVMELVRQGEHLDGRKLKEAADKFGCTIGSIRSDLQYMIVKRLERGSFVASAKTKQEVYKRDGKVCQYCGKQSEKTIIDHVVPMSQGGIGITCNLVVACLSCNMKKKKQTWIPNNLDAITRDRQDWRDLILGRASANQPEKGWLLQVQIRLESEEEALAVAKLTPREKALAILEKAIAPQYDNHIVS